MKRKIKGLKKAGLVGLVGLASLFGCGIMKTPEERWAERWRDNLIVEPYIDPEGYLRSPSGKAWGRYYWQANLIESLPNRIYIHFLLTKNIKNAYVVDEKDERLYTLIENGKETDEIKKYRLKYDHQYIIENPVEREHYFLVVEDKFGNIKRDDEGGAGISLYQSYKPTGEKAIIKPVISAGEKESKSIENEKQKEER